MGVEKFYFVIKSKQEFEAFPPMYKGVLCDFERCRIRCKCVFCTSVLFGSNFRKNAVFCPAGFIVCKFYDLQKDESVKRENTKINNRE